MKKAPRIQGHKETVTEETGTAPQRSRAWWWHRDVAFTHYMVANGSCWGEAGGDGKGGRGRAGLHRLQIQRLTLHPGRLFGQLPDATSVLGLCHPWVSALTLSQLLPLGPSGRGSSTISFDSFLHRGDLKDLAKPRALGGAWWQSERRAGIWSPAASPAPGEAGGAVRGCVYVHCSPGH